MTKALWQKLWLLVLIANDMPVNDAHAAFNDLYGNQPIDLNLDPIAAALAVLPPRH